MKTFSWWVVVEEKQRGKCIITSHLWLAYPCGALRRQENKNKNKNKNKSGNEESEVSIISY